MRVSASVSGLGSLDKLIAKSRAIGGPAQIAREARATVGIVRLLYLRGYEFARAPSGAPWARRRKPVPWPLLQKSGAMRGASRVTPETDGVRIVVPADYAQYQQPRRQFVPEGSLGEWEQPIGIARRNVGVKLG